MPQTAGTTGLSTAQRIVLAKARYTAEHNAPAMALIEHFTLGKGQKQVTVPKVGTMSVTDLVDGEDITDEEDIGMTTVDLTSAEVGGKVILTDKLVRQLNESVYAIIGRQLGEAVARKKDTDVHALYSGLNASVTLGLSGKLMSPANLGGCIAYAKANKFGSQLYVIHHPNAVADFVKAAAITPSATYPVPDGWAADLLKEFFVGLRPLNGVPIFEDGNLVAGAATVGAIANKDAMCVLESVKERTERQRDASLRATEVVITSDYGVFELDDKRGAPMTYSGAAQSTSA